MKPDWLKKKLAPQGVLPMQKKLRALGLHTVCEEARCPNLSECFSRGTATVMIMGDICTRSCKFCAVATGRPKPLDPAEPHNVAIWARELGLKHIVITSVDRDDRADQGAPHFAETIREVKTVNPKMTVEVLTPDFQGKNELVDLIGKAAPHIFNHNLETVARLTPSVRSAAKYDRSLAVIQRIKKQFPTLITKSGLMLGLGETRDEVKEAMRHLVDHGCDLLTLGQYLQPTKAHLEVAEYIPPAEFDAYRDLGLEMGFRAVFSGPFVRSSYLADEFFASNSESSFTIIGGSRRPPPLA